MDFISSQFVDEKMPSSQSNEVIQIFKDTAKPKIFIKQKFEILFTAYLSKQRLRNIDRPMKEVDAGGRRHEKNAKEWSNFKIWRAPPSKAWKISSQF